MAQHQLVRAVGAGAEVERVADHQVFVHAARGQPAVAAHQHHGALVLHVQAVVILDENGRIDHDEEHPGEVAVTSVQAARELDLPLLGGRFDDRGGHQGGVFGAGGVAAEEGLAADVGGEIAVLAIEHLAVRVEQGHRQLEPGRQQRVEQAVAAAEFGQPQGTSRFLELELEQLGGMVRLAQQVVGMLGQRTRQRLAVLDGLEARVLQLLADLVHHRRPHGAQKRQREDR